MEVDKAKIEVISKLPPPTTVKGIRSFLGHAGFYRRFIEDFSKITKPLCSLLEQGRQFKFDEDCTKAFNLLKQKLVTAPIVEPPDWTLPFELMCDASDYAVGAVLGQRKGEIFHLIYYASKTLNDAQVNYTTTEKEMLAVIFAFDKFRSYLIGTKIFSPDNSSQSNPRQKRVCHLLGTWQTLIPVQREQFLYNRLNELNWFRLARQPARANYNWVIERVPATAATINTILGLPNNEPSFYAMLGGFEEKDYEVIKNILCLTNTEWNTTGKNPNSVSRLSLQPEAKLWNTFVKRNLMPTSHSQTVDRTRLLLIHTILTGYRINVGEILAKELAAACANDKGILALPCLISALCRRAAVPMHDGDKYQPEKTGWTRVVYMRKMDVADTTPLNVAISTPPSSPTPTAATPEDPAAPAEPQQTPPASPPMVPISSHTITTSRATTPAVQEHSRASTPDTHLGSTPSSSPPPPAPAQSEEAAPPLHIMQLRSQLQRIEARQIHFHEEMKVFNVNLLKFLHFQFPAAAAARFFVQPSATLPQPNVSAAAQPPATASAQAGATEKVHFSSDDENDIFDWQSPRDHL
ncbi:hypothetical protein GQ457_09G016400 [Hibiscus cannabinus]